VGRPYTTKCSVRRQGRKRKTDENSSVFSSLAAFGKAACVRDGMTPRSVTRFVLFAVLASGPLPVISLIAMLPDLDGEALATLRTACVDHFAATGGLHAHAETVGTLATGNGRLESTFHVALTVEF